MACSNIVVYFCFNSSIQSKLVDFIDASTSYVLHIIWILINCHIIIRILYTGESVLLRNNNQGVAGCM